MKNAIQFAVGALLGAAWLAFGSAVAAETERVWSLPTLTDAGAWTAATRGARPFSFFSAEECLFVRFDCAKDNVADLRLKEPVPMPAEATGFTFLCGNNGACSGLWIRAIVQDAAGREFLFYTTSWFSFEKGLFFPEHFQRRVCEERFITPGFGRVKVEPGSNATIEGPGPNVIPQPPYTLVGLRFVGEHQREGSAFTEFFFRGFLFTRLAPRDSPLYYQFRDREGYGAVDPLPYLTPGHMGKWGGRRFDLCWEVRDAYDGNPFLADGKTFTCDPAEWQAASDKVPYPLQLAQRIEFPVREKGTYWVRVRLRWSADGKDPLPQEIVERDFRLDVINGQEPLERKPLPAETAITNDFVRIAPERTSLIYGPKERFVVKVLFRNPGTGVPPVAGRIAVIPRGGGDPVASLDVRPHWADGSPYHWEEVDLGDAPPGAYLVRAVLTSGDKVFDEVERLVGRQGVDKTAKVSVPSSVPSCKELLDRPRPMFHLSPMLPDALPQDSAQAWEDYYRPFLDRAGEVSTEIEFPFNWRTVEPLPGVFDWRVVDRFVDYAAAKGLTVLLWPSFRDLPEWMPAFYEMSEEGQVFGSRQAYLFHGGRPNYVHAAAIRTRLTAFLKATAQRYHGHPGVQGYFLCYEHPGDAPYVGWREGYARESVEAFRQASKDRWRKLKAVNRRWGTAYAAWDEVVPPAANSPSQYWLDWLRFKTDGIEGLLKDCVASIRSADAKRLIVMYADGLHDYRWFQEQGCMSANGGSHDTMAMPDYAACPVLGLPQRTEDHSPGNWSAYFPSQLDASVFAMMAGGGANAHCKAYVFTKNHFSDADDPNASLGRYKRFLPIWTELRATETATPIQAFVLKDLASYLVAAKTTYTGWWADPWGVVSLAQAQVPCAAGQGDLWKTGRLLIIGPNCREMEEGLIERVVGYVENGGTVLIGADSGRKCIERPAADWVLLQRLGIAPPTSDRVPDRKTLAVPAAGTLFDAGAKPFTLRDIWNVAPPTGMESVAFFEDDPRRAALSWKPVGKGKVAVLWAQTSVPPLFSADDGRYPYLRDVARWAGIVPTAAVTDDRIWTNLLKTKDGTAYYGLAHVGSWQGAPSTGVDGRVRWLVLPEGNYRVTELISGQDLGECSAAQLQADGIPVRLAPREVAIFRMTRQ